MSRRNGWLKLDPVLNHGNPKFRVLPNSLTAHEHHLLNFAWSFDLCSGNRDIRMGANTESVTVLLRCSNHSVYSGETEELGQKNAGKHMGGRVKFRRRYPVRDRT